MPVTTEDAFPRVSANTRVAELVIPLLIYLALSQALFYGPEALTTRIDGLGGDPLSFVWDLNWWPFALSHGLNPFITHYVWQPTGYNMAWSTSIPAAALLALPITATLGPVAAFNVLTIASPALSSWTTFLLARYLTRNWLASVVSGFLFGFSSYESGEMLGHTNLDLTFIVPVIALLWVMRVRGELQRWKFIIALTVAFVLQLGISTELLATSCVLGAMSWVAFCLCAPKCDRPLLLASAWETVAAFLAMILVASPFFVYLIRGLSSVPPEFNSVDFYSGDPFNYFIPTAVTRVGHNFSAPLASQFTGNWSEQGAYLGIPLLVILALYYRKAITHPYGRALFGATVLLFICSLGTSLHILDDKTGVLLPWRVFAHLPLIKSALPSRFTMYVSLAAAIAVALYLNERSGARHFRLAGVAIACLFIIPNSSAYTGSAWPSDPFFTPQNVRAALGKNENVLILPFVFTGPGIAWQIDSKMSFRQAGGYMGYVPEQETAYPAYSELVSGVPGSSFANDLAAYCVLHRIHYILVGPGTPSSLSTAIHSLGWPSKMDRGVEIVSAPDATHAHFYAITGNYWPSSGAPSWMGKHVDILTNQQPLTVSFNGNGRFPVHLTVKIGNKQSTYLISPDGEREITLPASAEAAVDADRIFIPDLSLHNGDTRSLSVLVVSVPTN